jgi:ABC-type polysaccharide/polyol phosphate transport system ATPase subunit
MGNVVVMSGNYPAISVRDLTKTYPGDLTPGRVLSHLLRKSEGKTVFRDVSFDVIEGQVVGVIGPNGAGKSTLLRLIAGQAVPTKGTVVTRGKILAILQIATGLQENWTGRENIRLLGSLYGMSDDLLVKRMASIIEFAQLDRFIDHPVRTYSAGMRARLAFSLVINADCDVLLIDESLSVGDAGFAQRCRERMHLLCRKGLTVMIVSHSMTAIRELCNRTIWLEGGRIVEDDKSDRVVEAYRLTMLTRAEEEFSRRYANRLRTSAMTSDLEEIDLWVSVEARGRSVVIPFGVDFAIHARLKMLRSISKARVRLEFLRVDGVVVAREDSHELFFSVGNIEISAHFGPMRLGRFPYECRWILLDQHGNSIAERVTVFAVENQRHSYNSSYYPEIAWHVSMNKELRK